jgi:hypothetical protein
MVKALLTVMVTCALAVSLSTQLSSQENTASASAGKSTKHKAAEEARWEGMVVRTSPDKQMLTVRKVGSAMEKTIYYDNSTQFVSQAHGSKKVNPIDASDIKDNDRVICRGKYDSKGMFHATVVSKRLTAL